jgi:hypothetical protein
MTRPARMGAVAGPPSRGARAPAPQEREGVRQAEGPNPSERECESGLTQMLTGRRRYSCAATREA